MSVASFNDVPFWGWEMTKWVERILSHLYLFPGYKPCDQLPRAPAARSYCLIPQIVLEFNI